LIKAWTPLAHAVYNFGNSETNQPLGHIKKPLENVLARAGIESFRWHGLRHDFASRLVMEGRRSQPRE
jgi:site-specific recombinase XerD